MTDTPINPYAAPTSHLHSAPTSGQVPSIHEALSRGYNFRIDSVFDQAWGLLKGSKGLILAGFLVLLVIVNMIALAIVIGLELSGIASAEFIDDSFLARQSLNLLISAVTYPFMAGIYMVGIRRAAGQPISFDLIFSQFGKFLPLLVTGTLMTALVTIGFFLLLIPGIYLSAAYLLAIPLVAERGLSPWQALETSRKAIHQHWFKVFGLLVTLTLATLLSIVPLGIGLIWTIPLFPLCIGVLYRIIFGVLPAAN